MKIKKKTKTKQPMKTILRIGLPLILAAVLLWGCAMTQLTRSCADRMLAQLPERMELIASDASRIVWTTPGFHGTENFENLAWWAEDFYWTMDSYKNSIFYPFPEWLSPFLLDLTGFENLPSELRYDCQMGIALADHYGNPLLVTGNLVVVNDVPRFNAESDRNMRQALTAQDPITFSDRTYSSIGAYAAEQISYWGYFNHYNVRASSCDPNYIATYNDQYWYADNMYMRCAVSVMCQPMPYCMLRLIPFYCFSFLVTALLVGIYLWIIQRKLLNPLHEQSATMDAQLPPMTQEDWMQVYRRGLRWVEPILGQSHQIRLKKLLASEKAEITRMETALDYARDAEENRKQLISNITHELKTPLAVIHSYAEGLQSGIAAEKKEHYVEVILDEADRMDAMVLQMLELSRLEAGRVKITLESFSFSELVQYVAEKFQPLLDAKNLSIRLELAEPLTIHASESRLEQVLTNYLSNAVRYTPIGGHILIHASGSENRIFFSITNTAPHLSKEGLEKVYDSFYREEASRSTKSTGLGLAIVKGIISLHSGDCFVSNTELDGESAVHFGFQIPR